VFVEAPSGELWVCECCYLNAHSLSLSGDQLLALHSQFAMEYRDHQRFLDAIRAGEKALELGASADVLAELAYVHSELGHLFEAAGLYRRALALDPEHFIATENLNQLLQTSGSA
jgi:tetratricopeptide (TPR) repeat protein